MRPHCRLIVLHHIYMYTYIYIYMLYIYIYTDGVYKYDTDCFSIRRDYDALCKYISNVCAVDLNVQCSSTVQLAILVLTRACSNTERCCTVRYNTYV
jgi:hypothetical protein